MTLRQLKAFLTAARLGSFTAAAGELGLAQASVSELVRRIEEDSGLPMFVRGGRRLVLTAAGTELLPYAEQALAAVGNAQNALRALRGLGGGTATFGVMRNAEYYLLPSLAQEFHESHPNVRVRLVGQNSVEVAAAVADGALEAGLVVLPIDGTGLDVRPLIQDEVFVATIKPNRYGSAVTIEDLATAELILYDAHFGWTDPTRRQLAEQAQRAGLRLTPIIEVEHVTSALQLAAQGLGDTIVSRAVAGAPGFPEGLSLVPFAVPLYDAIAFVQRQSSELSPATQRLLQLAEQMLRARAQ